MRFTKERSHLKFFTITIIIIERRSRTYEGAHQDRKRWRSIIGRAPFRNKCLAAFRRRRKKIERMDGRSVNEKRMEMKFDWRVETGGEV